MTQDSLPARPATGEIAASQTATSGVGRVIWRHAGSPERYLRSPDRFPRNLYVHGLNFRVDLTLAPCAPAADGVLEAQIRQGHAHYRVTQKEPTMF